MQNKCIVFTDGAARGNPGRGGWGSIVFTEKQPVSYIVELGGYNAHTTNNQMELQAVISALHYVYTNYRDIDVTTVYSDSKYVVSGITDWIDGWIKRGWKTSAGEAVQNRELWEQLYSVKKSILSTIVFVRIDGHFGIPGNERCDRIATRFADNLAPELYDGVFSQYPNQNILDVSSHESGIKKVRPKKSVASAGDWYISVVDGQLERHATWDECKSRTHKKSARYKRVSNSSDEREQLKAWGISM